MDRDLVIDNPDVDSKTSLLSEHIFIEYWEIIIDFTNRFNLTALQRDATSRYLATLIILHSP